MKEPGFCAVFVIFIFILVKHLKNLIYYDICKMMIYILKHINLTIYTPAVTVAYSRACAGKHYSSLLLLLLFCSRRCGLRNMNVAMLMYWCWYQIYGPATAGRVVDANRGSDPVGCFFRVGSGSGAYFLDARIHIRVFLSWRSDPGKLHPDPSPCLDLSSIYINHLF